MKLYWKGGETYLFPESFQSETKNLKHGLFACSCIDKASNLDS